ncbi:DUF3053 family protein [Terrihabitans sp. B22-R8]|uniref:DUF3053 family protein n=1 Tax=Terrihabitans sp. B22-R8 TaxID=3425128 RepID=UPI00403CEDCA
MMTRLVRKLTMAFALLGALAVASCGDSDAEHRKAFAQFLQTRIVDKPGLHVPQLTEDERKSFGSYAAHYAVITDFHTAMNDSVSPKVNEAMRKGGFTSAGELVTRKGDIEIARTTINQMAAALDGSLAKADTAHAGLDQPDDLKPVYDQAYERSVTQPAATFKSIVPVLETVFTQALDLGAYLEQHKSVITISGPALQVTDPAVLKEVNAKLQQLQSSQQSVLKAQQDMVRMIRG